jgi:hypothetical protein
MILSVWLDTALFFNLYCLGLNFLLLQHWQPNLNLVVMGFMFKQYNAMPAGAC